MLNLRNVCWFWAVGALSGSCRADVSRFCPKPSFLVWFRIVMVRDRNDTADTYRFRPIPQTLVKCEHLKSCNMQTQTGTDMDTKFRIPQAYKFKKLRLGIIIKHNSIHFYLFINFDQIMLLTNYSWTYIIILAK